MQIGEVLNSTTSKMAAQPTYPPYPTQTGQPAPIGWSVAGTEQGVLN
jgi:hypothetical protein